MKSAFCVRSLIVLVTILSTYHFFILQIPKCYYFSISGSFPLSETSLMTDEERERFLPVSRTFTSILEKDTLDVREMNLLLKQSRELTNELKKYGAENGFGDGAGSFGALGALAQGASTPLRRTSGGSSNNFNQFGVPTDGDQIVNVQGQGASFNTQFGKQNKQTNK